MSKSKLTICFDLDGTLVNSAPDLLAALDHALTTNGHPASNHQDIIPIIGHGAKAMLTKALKNQGLKNQALKNQELSSQTNTSNSPQPEPNHIDELWHILIDHYSIHIADQTHLFDGALETMETLKSEGHTLAICTNKTMNLTGPLLDKLDLTRHFSAICGADSFPYKKPDPRHLFSTIQQANNLQPAETPAQLPALMIGDSKTDIDTAKNANIKSVGVKWGYTDIPMEDLQPDYLISHFSELTEIVRDLANK